MIEILGLFYSIWNFYGDLGTFRKISLVIKSYIVFFRWYWQNPEIKIKYSKVISTKANNQTISSIKETLLSQGLTFNDGLIQTSKELSFELLKSHLSYRIFIDSISKTKDHLLIETKYVSFYPFRQVKGLNGLTSEFNKICEVISNPLKVNNINHIINIEILKLMPSKNNLLEFQSIGARVLFNKNKIQINKFYGTEQADFILFILIKWLTEYY